MKRYLNDATLALIGLGKVSDGAPDAARLALDYAIIKERREAAQEFLRRYERSQRGEYPGLVSRREH